MFSKELVGMIAQLEELYKAVDAKIIEESDGLASLGCKSRFNVFINDATQDNVTIEDLENLVGPVEFDYNYNGNNCYTYKIGDVDAYTLLNEKITRAGGAADDVRANTQA